MSAVGPRLVFLISAPRSGSTLLTRILHATGHIHATTEPHLLTPLAHLGPGARVDAAPYDPIQAQRGQRAFLATLADPDTAHRDACRAYADALYARALASAAPDGAGLFLDKTPAYALVLPFLSGLYPDARYVVLTRHPAAVFTSYADTFFGGDDAAALRHNPILDRYVPAIGRFLRERPIRRLHHLRYEDLVSDPRGQLRQLSAFLGVPFVPAALRYDRRPLPGDGPSDPTGVGRHREPTAASAERWAGLLAADPERFARVARLLARLSPDDLRAWGFPAEDLWAPMAQAAPGRGRPRSRYVLARRLLVAARQAVREHPRLQRVVRDVREVCDILLR